MVMFEQAKQDGKTLKQWVDMKDNRERKDHLKIGGTIIGINEYFQLPDCKMLYPHDYVNGTENQLSNCRCSVHYF
jgi:hypothetical protein